MVASIRVDFHSCSLLSLGSCVPDRLCVSPPVAIEESTVEWPFVKAVP